MHMFHLAEVNQPFLFSVKLSQIKIYPRVSFTVSCNNFEGWLHNIIKQSGVSYFKAETRI